MSRKSRRNFIKTSSLLVGAGYFATAGTRTALSNSALESLNVACIGVGGKGGSDSGNASKFGNVVAICDVDRKTLQSKGASEGFTQAEQFIDYRSYSRNTARTDIVTSVL